VSLPIRLFEYMAWGVPFVTSELPELGRLLGDARVGLFTPPGDTDAYAAGLAHLLASPDLRHALGGNGQRLVRTWLNWEREAQRLVELYDELLGVDRPATVLEAA
jgi:glycosyltransferase involved in cell wall biosynthesis